MFFNFFNRGTRNQRPRRNPIAKPVADTGRPMTTLIVVVVLAGVDVVVLVAGAVVVAATVVVVSATVAVGAAVVVVVPGLLLSSLQPAASNATAHTLTTSTRRDVIGGSLPAETLFSGSRCRLRP